MREGAGAYCIPAGSEVFTPLVAGWDILSLCPENALAGFERTAGKGSVIAAYNAALMHLGRALPTETAPSH